MAEIQPLRPFMEFVDSKGTLTKEAYDFLYNMFLRVGGSLNDLNAATLQDKTWEEPGEIGSVTPATGKFTTLQTTGAANFGGNTSVTNGDLQVQTIGRGLQIKEGANARMGVATLVGGTVTVANTSVTANTRIFAFCNTPGGTPGFLRNSARVAGTSFTILSSSATDTSTVAWLLVEPA